MGINSFSAGLKKRVDSELNPWRELLDNPKQWWDFRNSKLTGSVITPLFGCLLCLTYCNGECIAYLFLFNR